MKKMKALKRILTIALCMILALGCLSVPAEASTKGTTGAYNITVTTKKSTLTSPSITLKQQKQTVTFKKLTNSSKTKTKTGYYGCYKVKVYNRTKNKTTTYTWKRSQSKKISLDRNCSYTITVTYDSWSTISGVSAPLLYYYSKITNPYSWVSSTWNVITCY